MTFIKLSGALHVSADPAGEIDGVCFLLPNLVDLA
jgi:hypothetical protein